MGCKAVGTPLICHLGGGVQGGGPGGGGWCKAVGTPLICHGGGGGARQLELY